MGKPFVANLKFFGPKPWWCFTDHDAKDFNTWREAMDYAVSLVNEPTA